MGRYSPAPLYNYNTQGSNIFSRVHVDSQDTHQSYLKTSPLPGGYGMGQEHASRANRCQGCGGMLLGIYQNCDRCARHQEKPQSPAYPPKPARGSITRDERYGYSTTNYEMPGRYGQGQGQGQYPDLRGSVYRAQEYSSVLSSLYEPKKNYFVKGYGQEAASPRSRVASPPARLNYDRTNSIDKFYQPRGRAY